MRPLALTAFFLLACIIPVIVFSQSKKARIGKKSSWIHAVTYNDKAVPGEGEGTSSYYLLIDEQENTLTHEDYNHYAYKILTSEGLQDMSDLTFDFDPAYQELIFHEIKIIRNGIPIDKLTNDIRTVQREQSMDRYLYDGSQTAIINLKDVRTGDIIEYAFTRKGNNPVYEGHISRSVYFDYSLGFEKSYKRIVLSNAKAQTIKFAGGKKVEFIKELLGEGVSYSWTFERTKPFIHDSNLPDWYDPFRYAIFTDFKSWEEVVAWSEKLFVVNGFDQAQMNEIAERTFRETEKEKYTLEVIRFVQDEIRYLGFENGLNSHKPHAPLKVFEQRFGDCKDKSLLLVTLLRAKGVEAYPVLLNTTLRDKVVERLPAANIFDHCVVKIMLDEKPIFIDPTISNQGGSLDKIPFPNYRTGLVISPSTTALENFPDLTTSMISEEQSFDLMTVGGEAMLTVRTTYTGSEADYQRSEFARNNLQSVQKNYQDYYANLYSDITKWEEIKVQDNRRDNVLTVEEKYKIPTFWKTDENDDGLLYAEVYPQTLANYFNITKSSTRTAPYRLTYPVDYHHNIHVNLPEKWNIEPVDETIENENYEYEYIVRARGNELSRLTYYKTKRDHIPAANFERFTSDHQKMMNNLSYRLTYNKKIIDATKSTMPGIIVTILSIIVTVSGVFALYNKYNPRPELPYLRGTPIGGWLFLVGIGVTLTPFRILFDLINDPDLITGAGWMGWLAAKKYGLFGFTLFTHLFNIFNLLFTILIVILFYQRRSSFPRLMSIELALGFVITTSDILISRSISASPAEIGLNDIFRTFFAAAIWIPYLNISTRVKETFVIRLDEDDEESGDNITQESQEAERVER